MTLTFSEGLLLFFVFLYIIVVSIYGDKYNEQLSVLKKIKILYGHKKCSLATYEKTIKTVNYKIKKLKLASYLVVVIFGLAHVIFVIFWLKGSGTIDSNSRLRRTTRIFQ